MHEQAAGLSCPALRSGLTCMALRCPACHFLHPFWQFDTQTVNNYDPETKPGIAIEQMDAVAFMLAK